MFREEREDIINNNNTAQEKFTAFVEQLSKPIKKVEIQDSLDGDLNLSIFQRSKPWYSRRNLFQGKITVL